MKKKVLCQWPVGRLKTLLKPGIRKNLFYSLIYDFTTSFTTKDKLSFLLVNSRWIRLHEYISNIYEKLREGNMHVTNAIEHVTLRPRSHYTCIYITNNLAAATIISIICQKYSGYIQNYSKTFCNNLEFNFIQIQNEYKAINPSIKLKLNTLFANEQTIKVCWHVTLYKRK